jgi:serine-type D-Ala-D-Ala carboxypeptidase/endopeptidase
MHRVVHLVTAVLLANSALVFGALKDELGDLADGYLKTRTNCALVIGVWRPIGTQITGFGKVAGGNPPNPSTMFEIGSITKVFTGIVLQRLVDEGLLKLGDVADQFLPNGLKLPQRDGRPITLRDLATHTSGLRRLPDNFRIRENPYAKYSTKDLYECLSHTALQRPPGKDYEYSNLGFGLLGHILELRAGKPYEALIREKLLLPLGMTNTVIRLSAQQRARLAPGHDPKGQPTGNWEFDVLAPAGAFRSSASDLLTFLSANLRPDRRPFPSALRGAQTTHFRSQTVQVGLGWHKLETKDGLNVIWHNGGTGGYVSFLGLAPRQQAGVVVLSNYGDALANDRSLDKLALEVLKWVAADVSDEERFMPRPADL